MRTLQGLCGRPSPLCPLCYTTSGDNLHDVGSLGIGLMAAEGPACALFCSGAERPDSLSCAPSQVTLCSVHLLEGMSGLQVLKEFVAAYGPLAIMLEDLHHFDSISWHFLTTVVENMSHQVMVVATMRPNDGVLSVASRHEEGTQSTLSPASSCIGSFPRAESG